MRMNIETCQRDDNGSEFPSRRSKDTEERNDLDEHRTDHFALRMLIEELMLQEMATYSVASENCAPKVGQLLV